MRDWLVQFRKIKGYTQKEVAELCGISRSYYAGVEQGSANASGHAAKSIADVLGFNMELFFAENRRDSRQNNNTA